MGCMSSSRLLFARSPVDGVEEGRVRKLAGARHAPADWVLRARIVTLSWARLTVPQIAEQVGCHPRTVRARIHRFNAEGLAGLGDRSGRGRPRRISEDERSQIVALVKTLPPGRLRYDRAAEALVQADQTSTAAVWTLDALTEIANQLGIVVGRSQVRRILLADGARWRQVRSWAVSKDPQFVPKGQPSSTSTPVRQPMPQLSASTSSAR